MLRITVALTLFFNIFSWSYLAVLFTRKRLVAMRACCGGFQTRLSRDSSWALLERILKPSYLRRWAQKFRHIRCDISYILIICKVNSIVYLQNSAPKFGGDDFDVSGCEYL